MEGATGETSRARSPWRAFGVLAIAVFLEVLDLFIVNIAFPDIRRSVPKASLASLSWILSGYAIVFAAVLVPAGKLADIVGRKRVFLAGLLIFAAAAVLLVLFTVRSARHPAPVVELPLLRPPAFALSTLSAYSSSPPSPCSCSRMSSF